MWKFGVYVMMCVMKVVCYYVMLEIMFIKLILIFNDFVIIFKIKLVKKKCGCLFKWNNGLL